MPVVEGRTWIDLDPSDWGEFRTVAHKALDNMINYIANIRDRPVWRAPSDKVRAHFARGLPRDGTPLEEVLEEFECFIKPFATGNLHPAFMGWVHGAGTPVGMLAEMLAGGLNANCGGRDHIAIEVERQITRWMTEIFEFPATASGLFVTGTSLANFLGVIVARNAALGDDVGATGMNSGPGLVAYASEGVHGCVAQAIRMSGVGSNQLRRVPCDINGRLDLGILGAMVDADKERGLRPFLVVGTAGSVDQGAIDPLDAIADFASLHRMWFHVDGAFGALAAFSPVLRPRILGIERADSIAFDFHKWAHVPYDAGFFLVRDGEAHRRAFVNPSNYLSRSSVGLAAGDVWPCDLGPDLSRGFRALKTWFTLKTFGANKLGECMLQTCYLAKYLEQGLSISPRFRICAPVKLNIVCFSVIGMDPDNVNRAIVDLLHVEGRAVPSITILGGMCVIRCAIVNHRTTYADIDGFLNELEGVAARLVQDPVEGAATSNYAFPERMV